MKRILLVGILLGCTNSPNASFAELEESRLIAKENAQQLAQMFRAENDLADWKIYMRGDSTISAKCPQGDGWASISLLKGKKKIDIKCSTVSLGLGCMLDKDFKSKTYANQDGKCNDEIPKKLPKLTM